MRYGYYANGFRFDSHLANFRFFSLLFLGLGVTFSFRVRLVLWLGSRLGHCLWKEILSQQNQTL